MILVIGGTGLVGSHLLYHLSLTENKIRATFRREEKLQQVKHVFSYYTDQSDALFEKIEWVPGSLNDFPALTDAFKDITYVYHCAAKVSFDPNQYHKLRKTNIEGTANVVNLCTSNKVRKLCYVSSVAAIGEAEPNKPADEQSPWNKELDHNIYAITKYGGEMEVWRGSQEGIDVIVVNPGIIIGPGFWRTSSGSLIRRVHKGLKHYTTGKSGYIDIHDVVLPMIRLMNSEIKNERFILVAEHLSFKDFAEQVAINLNIRPPYKKASKFFLKLIWRFDWLIYFVRRKRRKLTRHMVRSITTDSHFRNDKIKNVIDYQFKPISQSIEETCLFYLNDLN